MPLRPSGEAYEAVSFLLNEVFAECHGKAVQLLGCFGGLHGMAIVTPRKIQQSLIAVTASVGEHCQNNTLKVACGLHRALEGLVPEVAVQGFGLFLLGKNDDVVLAVLTLIQ